MTRVMIADDSQMARMFIRKCLEIAGLQGAEFVEAENGQEVLDVLGGGVVEAVFMDLTMPVMDGRSCLRKLRASGDQVPVVVISSSINSAIEQELSELGAYAVVKKPPSPAQLATIIKGLKAAV